MGKGYLTVQTITGNDALPIENARVVIREPDGVVLYGTYTDANGNTDHYPLSAPDAKFSLDPNYKRPAYSEYAVDCYAEGFLDVHIQGVQILDTQTAILPIAMEPLADESNTIIGKFIDIQEVGLLVPSTNRQLGPPEGAEMENMLKNVDLQQSQVSPIVSNRQVYIPDYITVHLGIPTNASARNVRVSFPNYIKNVVSSEIYSTWPHDALVANAHVIVTFALNRVYTEWYRVRGFDFDITNSTGYDQYYRDGAMIFENISQIVDDIFNVYARRKGFRNPFFTQYCNGTTSTCPGLSQWGTVTLANQGLNPLEILHYYYPNDLELTATDNIQGIVESFPGTVLRVGSQGESVLRMQNYLNRVRVNYPLIPVISNPNGAYGTDTEEAVRVFQRTFNLAADGAIGRGTWNRISFIYVGVIRLGELDSEGERVGIGAVPPNVVLSQGSRGQDVLEVQFILNYISPYHPAIPTVIQDGVFGPGVKNAVIEFQKLYNLNPDGIVGAATWAKLYASFEGIEENVKVPPMEPIPPSDETPQYPGSPLAIGTTGVNVRLMQTYLNTIRIVYTTIPYLEVDAQYGPATERAVTAFQEAFLLSATGVIDEVTWNKIVEQYLLVTGGVSVALQYPGTPLRVGSRGSNVRLMQGFLSELRSPYPSLPSIAVDGIFGHETETAVRGFQRLFDLTPDGIIGPLTWYAIIDERNAAV